MQVFGLLLFDLPGHYDDAVMRVSRKAEEASVVEMLLPSANPKVQDQVERSTALGM